jgi:hypothetical protein
MRYKSRPKVKSKISNERTKKQIDYQETIKTQKSPPGTKKDSGRDKKK